jgi:hypothetical protein
MRSLLLALVAVTGIAGAAHADAMDRAEAREHAGRVALASEAKLVEIADRDILTARIEQGTAERAITRARDHRDRDALVYWSHRMAAAHADEAAAAARYGEHTAAREQARTQLRHAVAELERLRNQQATR